MAILGQLTYKLQSSTQKALSEKNVTIGLCDSSGRTCQLSPIEKTYCRHADYNFRVVQKKPVLCMTKPASCPLSVFECCCLKIAFNFGLCFLLLHLKLRCPVFECVTFKIVNYCSRRQKPLETIKPFDKSKPKQRQRRNRNKPIKYFGKTM